MSTDYPDKPLKELTDTELLDFMDKVSAEVKTRNTLKLDAIGRHPEEAIRTAIDTFVNNIDRNNLFFLIILDNICLYSLLS